MVGTASGTRALIGIEAKADESFGSASVGAYLESSRTKPRSNVPERIRRLVISLFGPEGMDGKGVSARCAGLPYQLVTALVGTLIEAQRRWAQQAVFLIHEFRSDSVPELGYRGTRESALARNAAGFATLLECLGVERPDETVGLAGPFRPHGSDLVAADLPFFVGKTSVDLGREPAVRKAASQAP